MLSASVSVRRRSQLPHVFAKQTMYPGLPCLQKTEPGRVLTGESQMLSAPVSVRRRSQLARAFA